MFSSWCRINETSDITSTWRRLMLLMMVVFSDSVLLGLHQLQLFLSHTNGLSFTLLATLRALDHTDWLSFVVLGGFARFLLEAELSIRADMLVGPVLVLLARALQRAASLSDPASFKFNGQLSLWLIFFLVTGLVKHDWDPVNLVGSFSALFSVVVWDLSRDRVCYQWLEIKVA